MFSETAHARIQANSEEFRGGASRACEETEAGSAPEVFDMAAEEAKQVTILAVDCGMKNNIIRYFVESLRVKLIVVPWDYDFTQDEFDGLFLSNGPGNPLKCEVTIGHVREVMLRRPTLPIFGICLGNQILGLASGATTYKMKFGNRGMNQPCVDMRTTRCYITPQNHGFAIDNASLSDGWMPLMINANDGSNEGTGAGPRAKYTFCVGG
ncbi:unnamed protein product [Prorocentrum cordatum]|uniref:carbamoyl-phosphate synthase (glutamine-hydrolyzing) n=1 Tax=Prorocentrum cordatum TaxID=2364126 RepID=A0ABN9UVR3_9DINO|nr:unnamed protein product [Polarella glacialis]